MKKIFLVILWMVANVSVWAQQRITLDAAIAKAMSDYPSIRASRLNARSADALRKSASILGNMELSGGGEEIGHGNDAVYTLARLRQDIDPFGAHGMRRRLQAQAGVAQAETGVIERELIRQVCADYINDHAALLRYENMSRMDSLYADFSRVARLRYEAKAISLLEYQTALHRSQQVKLSLQEAKKDLQMAHLNLSRWLSTDTIYQAAGVDDTLDVSAILSQELHPKALLGRQLVNLSQAVAKEASAQRLPKFFLEAGVQKLGSQNGYYAWQVGVSIPIAFGATKATVKSARLSSQRARADAEEVSRQLASKRNSLRMEYDKYLQSVDYYHRDALPLAKEQKRIALLSYQAGSIGYLDFIQAVNGALTTEMNYVEAYTKLLEAKYNLIYY